MGRWAIVSMLGLTLLGCASRGESTAPAKAPVSSQMPDNNATQRARIRTELGSLYLQEGRFAVALDEARAALVADPSYAPAFALLGLTHMYMGERGPAEENFQRALRLAPEDPEISNNYGWFLCQSGRERASLEYFLKAARNPLYTTPTKPYTNAGVCQVMLNELGAALENLTLAYRLAPQNTQAMYWLAEVSYRTGKFEESRRWIGEIERLIDPSSGVLWLALRTERKLDNRDGENRYAVRLRKQFSDSPETKKLLRGEYD
jgi:type IV pilus assembly protein PilF